ncbi:Bifunctional lysine-specific demethylase and histidyl-hydroxylase NO66 [Frankliniella fusca]|uniref:Bifunctional lysine-specific demethylase and histidyl-hydroxylase NO66 n=1 Tax=Frankliniella fusca TaxID=407009 RepID=A0AAE1LF60_9NEOP|nr:Bifunctional lysine-specific demethylase and histidyl-hydroxylase NO66 [Frankliniella fusca]
MVLRVHFLREAFDAVFMKVTSLIIQYEDLVYLSSNPARISFEEFSLSIVSIVMRHNDSLSGTLDKATYNNPKANSDFPASRAIATRVSPWDLCIVHAQHKDIGSW